MPSIGAGNKRITTSGKLIADELATWCFGVDLNNVFMMYRVKHIVASRLQVLSLSHARQYSIYTFIRFWFSQHGKLLKNPA
jgi:hypothetical protein